MKSLYKYIINSSYLLKLHKSITRLAKVNIKYIHKQCLTYLYNNIDINYLTTFLKKNKFDINNKNEFNDICSLVSSDITYAIFLNIMKKLNQSDIDEVYDDLLAEANFLNDVYSYIYPRIKSIIYKKPKSNKSIIDFNTLNYTQKEKFISKIIKKIIDNNPEKYSVDLSKNISLINSAKISQDNFLNDYINQYTKILLNNRTEIITKLVDDTLTQIYKIMNLKLTANIKNDIEDIIMTNLGDYLEYISKQIFTDEKEIKRILNKYNSQLSNIKRQVMQAYDNIKEWLKSDYPDLKLYKLTENDIYIYPDHKYPGISAFCAQKNLAKKFNFPVEIHISQSVANSDQTRLTNTIYHELIHAIKGQADTAREISDIELSKNHKLTHDEFQEIVHNDKIWDQGIDTVRKHTHLDARGYNTNADISHANHGMSQLRRPHEASIVCYNCGWFNVYPKWNNDCDKALNGNFQCPKCHSNDVKLIPAQAGEKQLLEDALSHIHYQVAEQMPYMPPNESRLKKRKEYENTIKLHNLNNNIASICIKEIPNVVTDNFIMELLNNYHYTKDNNIDEICETITGDICSKIFNKVKNKIQNQYNTNITYDDLMELNDYSDILNAIITYIKPKVLKLNR